MAYDLEEQEQLAALKAWWKDNGTLVIVTASAAALAFAGWQGWQLWRDGQVRQAATAYETLVKGLAAGDAKVVRESSGTLIESHPKTLYASMAALATARFHVERSDLKSAKAQLQWALDRSPSEEMRELARLRLAGVLLDEKGYDEALKLLGARHSQALAGQYAALRGDVLVALKRIEDARAAYRLALEKSDPQRHAAFRETVQVRLDALGG
jgi:predicted negative regulator of RcsB-dependent stress response